MRASSTGRPTSASRTARATFRRAWPPRRPAVPARRCRCRRRRECRRSDPAGPSRSGRPGRRTRRVACSSRTSAPPDRSSIAPSTVPRPMMTAMCPRMVPNPVSSKESPLLIAVPTMSVTGSPAARASPRPVRSRATNGSSLTLMMVNSRIAIASPQRTNSPGVVVRSHSMAELIDMPFRTDGWCGISSGIARRMLRERRYRTSCRTPQPGAEQRRFPP